MTSQTEQMQGAMMNIHPAAKITIRSNRLRTPQVIHAFIILVVPLLGTIAAVFMAVTGGIDRVSIGTFGVMYLITMFGITMGFHRLFTHCAYRTSNVVRAILAIAGSMAAQGPLIYWVSNHRRHHQFSDQPGDTHSPYFNKEGESLSGIRKFWYAHVGWTFDHDTTNNAVFSKDLLHDPFIMKINNYYFLWVFLGLALPTLAGGLITGTWMGLWSGFLWGGCVRLFLIYHVTSSINSITHLFGQRPFKTKEYSTNNVWLALPTGGEAWHNNHHAFPHSAIFGLRWWQIDLGGLGVCLLEALGFVWQVKRPTAGMIQAKLGRN